MRILLSFTIIFTIALIACKKDAIPSRITDSGSLIDSLDAFFHKTDSSNTVFTNVTIITMQGEQVLTGKDVYVRKGLVERIVDAGEVVDVGFTVVDGTGKYLIPGLADMHTHPIVSPNLTYDLFLYLAQGVTTIRVMWGFDGHVELRDEINNSELLGPTMYVASAGFDGANQTWPGSINTSSVEDVKNQIDRFSGKSYDFIKIYSGINSSQYSELVDYAWQKNIPPIGHVPSSVDVKDALSQMKSISHLGKFRSSSLPDDELFTILANSTTMVCPTMTVLNRIRGKESEYTTGWYDFVSPQAKIFYNQTSHTLLGNDSFYKSINNTLIAIQDAGATVIAGTDTGIRFVLPGISLHEELGYYVNANMSPYQALKTSTANVEEFLETKNHTGTVSEGKVADLVLLDANPMEDISNTNSVLGIMKNGRWVSKEEIDNVLSLISEYYRSIQ